MKERKWRKTLPSRHLESGKLNTDLTSETHSREQEIVVEITNSFIHDLLRELIGWHNLAIPSGLRTTGLYKYPEEGFTAIWTANYHGKCGNAQ